MATFVTIIVLLSVLFQLASAIIAVWLVKVTRRRVAWFLVAVAITLMALRRIESLILLLSGGPVTTSLLIFEVLGIVTSVLMFTGIYLIKPLFTSIIRSEDELLALNGKLSRISGEQRLLLEHTKDFIYRHDPQGIITYVSPAVERVTGFSAQEWLAHYSVHYTANPVNRNGLDTTEGMLRSGAPGHPYIVEVRHKNGGTVWLEVNKQPYLIEGSVAGFIGVARDITVRVRLEEERENLIVDLQDALSNIKTLRGLLPICSSCKKVRDDKGYWNQIEAYVSEHSEAEFTHGICPECAKKLYPEFCAGDTGKA